MQELLNMLAKPRTLGLLGVIAAAVLLRTTIIGVGAPHITIDDDTAFEGGFLVWFGNAPPQRMYIESWIYGIVCLSVYVAKVMAGVASTGVSINLVADAYRDFHANPQPYVLAYRWFTLGVDLLTIWLVFRIARHALQDRLADFAAVLVAAMYALSYNFHWSGIVARPDSLLAFFCALGLLMYLRSNGGRDAGWLIGSAILLGVAAGQKLHGAFLAIFLCFDLLRIHGLRIGIKKFILFASVSFFLFCVAAGSVLFDPLVYVKLRFANYRDDASPWIQWGDQFVTILRGTGWLVIPATLAGALIPLSKRTAARDQHLQTIAVVAIGWLLLFASIRQMRAYWMLPALPAFYIMAVYAISTINFRTARLVLVGAVLTVLSAQSIQQALDLRAVPYEDLRKWVINESGNAAFYILGYDALTVPKSHVCIDRTKQMAHLLMQRDREVGASFTEWHVTSWEERSSLTLLEMLENGSATGFEFYDFYSAPPEVFNSVVGWERIKYLVVQEGFDLDLAPSIKAMLDSQFELVSERTGAGGGGRGLTHRIYGRR